MIELADHESRERFTSELDKNFSVIASAGSGKTRAITERIVKIAKSPHARKWLPELVVVTYTNRAADELQQRAREQILESDLSLDVLAAFNRAFFGTIHSFCLKLLASYGHYLGLPPNLETITSDDENLWDEFVQRQTTIARSLNEESRTALLRFVQVRELMELARRSQFDSEVAPPQERCPDTDFSEVYSCVARGRTVRTIPKLQEELRRWEKRWRETKEFVPLPICTSDAKEFSQAWREAFRPLREWINACAACVSAEVKRGYREFRLERGAINYRDQVALAIELMRHPEAVRRVREKNYRVILDEAQDTDPQQFRVLLEIARPPAAAGIWTQDRHLPPRPGHFCMVGDFQQSIYRDRADLNRYRELHEGLTKIGAAEEVKFSVTFRLDRTQLNFVNRTFGEILNNLGGQVEFVELNPRPDALPGQLIRLDLGAEVDPTLREEQRARIEARQLAEWLRASGLKKLRANSWRQVAILSPRKAWLPALRDALREADLRAQIQSESDRNGESPAYAWFTALLTIMSDPCDGYEIVGVLRDVFGISDDALARFAQGDGTRFQIAEQTLGCGVVAEKLNLLARTCNGIAREPLFTAVREIVCATQLRERLLSLPADDFAHPAAELDALLTSAATAEAAGMTRADLAENLRANFDATREVRPSSEDAIQLLTVHKAKGLEWQVVIVPFLSRLVRTGSSRYPRAIKTIEEGLPQIAFAKADLPPELQSELKESERQEMERLLYVALTRAKHSLVLASDRQLFAKPNGELHKDSQLKWLRCDSGERNEETFAALVTEPRECSETSLRQSKSAIKIDIKKEAALPALSADVVQRAQRRARDFVRKLNPSELPAEEESSTAGTELPAGFYRQLGSPALANPAMRYGVWWHDFIQRVPWHAGANSWDKIFQTSCVTSPDAARSAREWRLLRDRLSSRADFQRHFIDEQFLAHPEMPFFWKLDEERCLEGIVDLAFFDPAARSWLIVDWKTDRVATDKVDILRARYRPQLAAYWTAVREMTEMHVEAAIYSTPTAGFVRYEQNELAREWARLKALPLEQVAAEMAVDQKEPPVQLEFAGV